MIQIPLQAVPSQALSVNLDGQSCYIAVYQRYTGLYLDLYLDSTLIIAGVICQHLNPIVMEAYRGFSGDLTFYDTQGSSDPDYTGLADRWQFVYLSASEL